VSRSVEEWLAAYASALGLEAPDETTREDLLALAGVAAHASERMAAPLSCWLAARAGIAPGEALRIARELAGEEARS
jgi:hypothetical protein